MSKGVVDQPRDSSDREEASGSVDRSRAIEPGRICPNCETPLLSQRCKLRCPNRACGFYLSCADFY